MGKDNSNPTDDEEKTQLECQHCEYVWDYGGQAEYYACCPRCRYKVPVEKQTVEQDDDQEPNAEELDDQTVQQAFDTYKQEN